MPRRHENDLELRRSYILRFYCEGVSAAVQLRVCKVGGASGVTNRDRTVVFVQVWVSEDFRRVELLLDAGRQAAAAACHTAAIA